MSSEMHFGRRLSIVAAVILWAMATPVLAAPVFDSFGPLPQATFGGSGIPNDAVAISSFEITTPSQSTVSVTLGLTATERFANPPVGNDGAGTFFAGTGANFGGPGDPSSLLGAKWNFGYFIGLTGGTFADIADILAFDLRYDTSPDGLDFGVWDLSASIAALGLGSGSVFEDSQNLLFSFLNTGVPGFITPPASAFDAGAAGTYSFELLATDANGNRVGLSAIDVRTVPEPASALPMLFGILSLAALRRRRKRPGL
ncbi:MAG: PEP-CTERM sorting domain-containing protein [Alphaproteobacteria bacterium]|nr:MAG: PEP-CTERM sorting domain-containing protein [Alphaproteobacteria bacterium]